MARRVITREMMEEVLKKGWNANQAADALGLHRQSVADACERFGIVLPKGKRGPEASDGDVSCIMEASNTRVKAFSVSPEAIKRWEARA